MNHKKRADAWINYYERERAKYETKIEQFQREEKATETDIGDFDRVVDGSLQNVESARRNDKYGAKVKAAVDKMPEWETICQYYGISAAGNGATARPFGDINSAGDAGAAYGVGAGAAGIGVGVGAAAGAYGLAGAIGVASTGTAIGSLSGAAATSASLAWLGGGALAAGGLGMVGGIAALTGIGLIPLAGAGIIGGVLYKRRNKKRADAIANEVSQKVGEMNQAQLGMNHAMESLSRLGNTVRRNAAEIRVLNNRHLGPAVKDEDSDRIVQESRTLIRVIHQAITEVQDLWNEAASPGSSTPTSDSLPTAVNTHDALPPE